MIRRISLITLLIASAAVAETSIITKQGQIIRIQANEIRQAGRSTQGVRLVNVEAGDQVAAASLIPDSEVVGNGQEDLPLQ